MSLIVRATINEGRQISREVAKLTSIACAPDASDTSNFLDRLLEQDPMACKMLFLSVMSCIAEVMTFKIG